MRAYAGLVAEVALECRMMLARQCSKRSWENVQKLCGTRKAWAGKWGRHEGSNGAVCFESVGLVVVAR